MSSVTTGRRGAGAVTRPSDRPFVIGGNLNGPADMAILSLRGAIDDGYLFARALTDAEVAELAR